MSYFRTRIVNSGALPQLPSGIPAIANIPQLTSSIQVVNVTGDTYSVTPPTVSLTSLVPTQTKNATSP